MLRRALVIGNNSYPYLKNQPGDPAQHLTTPAIDAEEIAQILEHRGDFKVQRLPEIIVGGVRRIDPDPDVSRLLKISTLEEAIASLFHPAGKTPEVALLFFAGHGLCRTILPGKIAEFYLAASDSDPKNNRWGVSLHVIRNILESSLVHQQIVWCDCCNSGGLEFSDIERVKSDSNFARCFLGASQAFQLAYEQPDGQHGVLGGAIIDGLNSQPKTNIWITNHDLSATINGQLEDDAQEPVLVNQGTIRLVRWLPKEVEIPASLVTPFSNQALQSSFSQTPAENSDPKLRLTRYESEGSNQRASRGFAQNQEDFLDSNLESSLVTPGLSFTQPNSQVLFSDSNAAIALDQAADSIDIETFKHQRLEQKQARLQKEWTLENQKLEYLNTALIAEANAATKFQLKNQIEAERKKLSELEKELYEVEQALCSIQLIRENTLSSTSDEGEESPREKLHAIQELHRQGNQQTAYLLIKELRLHLRWSSFDDAVKAEILQWQARYAIGIDNNVELAKELARQAKQLYPQIRDFVVRILILLHENAASSSLESALEELRSNTDTIEGFNLEIALLLALGRNEEAIARIQESQVGGENDENS